MSSKPNKNRLMKRWMLFGCMALVVALFSSCLKDSESTVTYSGDAAITAFSLGNLKKYTKVKAKNGSDSTAVATVSGSGYKFYIDQVERTIYNPDSLPYGIDAKHVLCTISSKNSGIITIKSMISDSLFYYRSEDSIDFSVPRTIQVNSLDGKNRARYTVKVNVHKEPADSFLWDNVGAVGVFQNAVEMKAVALNEKVFVFANDGISTFVFSTPENGIGWNDVLEENTVHDDYRIDYMRANIASMKDAVELDGIPLMGYLYWGCVDMVSNGEGEMAKRYGQIYVDADNYGKGSFQRLLKDSYFWYRKCIQSNGEDLD